MNDRRIKLVHLTSSLKIGGAERILYDLVTHLDHQQFEHHVIYFHAGPYVEMLCRNNIPVYQVTGLFFQYDPLFFWRLYRLIKTLKPDCLHTLLWAANVLGRLIARMGGITCVSVFHNNVDQDGWIRNLIDTLTLPYADKLIAVSEHVKRSIQERHAWLPAQRLHVIPNGIDAEAVRACAKHAQKTRAALGLSDEHFVIGSVGRFVPVKNYGLLLHSFTKVLQKYEQARLVLVGTGPQEQWLRVQAKELNIDQQVIFVVGQQAYGYYPLFDCFVLASCKEGISIALLEAMSCGVPCVVTNEEPEHPVLDSYENGIVVPADDVDQLARGITQLVLDDQLRGGLAQQAQATARQQFHCSHMLKAYHHMFLIQAKKAQEIDCL